MKNRLCQQKGGFLKYRANWATGRYASSAIRNTILHRLVVRPIFNCICLSVDFKRRAFAVDVRQPTGLNFCRFVAPVKSHLQRFHLMDVQSLHRCPQQTVDTLLGSVALYKQVYLIDPGQFEVLLRYSQLVEARPGEVVIEEGQIDTWLYFLLRGQLAVYAGTKSIKKVNAITPGEIFGDMAILLDLPRSATVISDVRTKLSVVMRTDFSIFGEPQDLGCIRLPVKLLFYRTMVHNLRWKLEVYRSQFPEHHYAADHRKIRLYTGPRDSLEELMNLDEQARRLAELLVGWNILLTREDEMDGG